LGIQKDSLYRHRKSKTGIGLKQIEVFSLNFI